MAQIIGVDQDRSKAKRRFIQDLALFISMQKAKLKVVFDGVPDDEFPENCKFKSVHIMYARPGSDADSRIKSIIRKSSYKRDLIIVSSDRDLVHFAKSQGTKVISSVKFRSILQECYLKAEDKSGSKMDMEVQDWLDYFNSG